MYYAWHHLLLTLWHIVFTFPLACWHHVYILRALIIEKNNTGSLIKAAVYLLWENILWLHLFLYWEPEQISFTFVRIVCRMLGPGRWLLSELTHNCHAHVGYQCPWSSRKQIGVETLFWLASDCIPGSLLWCNCNWCSLWHNIIVTTRFKFKMPCVLWTW